MLSGAQDVPLDVKELRLGRHRIPDAIERVLGRGFVPVGTGPFLERIDDIPALPGDVESGLIPVADRLVGIIGQGVVDQVDTLIDGPSRGGVEVKIDVGTLVEECGHPVTQNGRTGGIA